MNKRQSYNTKARNNILDFLASEKESAVSAADITEYLVNSGIKVNQATVYRCLNRLSDENRLLKFTDENTQKSLYRLIDDKNNCDEHIHIKCVKCGRLLHLECDFMHDIKKHLSESHGFELQCDGSILYGICENCRTDKSNYSE